MLESVIRKGHRTRHSIEDPPIAGKAVVGTENRSQGWGLRMVIRNIARILTKRVHFAAFARFWLFQPEIS